MDTTFHSAVLFVKDIEKSKRFYTKVLGQRIKMDFGKNVIFESGVTVWELRRGHIIENVIGTKDLDRGNRFELCFESVDIESDFARLKSFGVKFLHDLIEEPWGQFTVRFFDPDDHIIEIGESLRSFVKRFHDSGLSFDEISERTSIPIDDVKDILK